MLHTSHLAKDRGKENLHWSCNSYSVEEYMYRDRHARSIKHADTINYENTCCETQSKRIRYVYINMFSAPYAKQQQHSSS